MWSVMLLSFLGCYKQVKIQETLELYSDFRDEQYCTTLEAQVELRPQKYVGDKLYTPRSTAQGKTRLVADIIVPFGSHVSSLEFTPSQSLSGATVMVALVPTANEQQEGVAKKIMIQQQLADSLGDTVADNTAVHLPIFGGNQLSPKRKRLRARFKEDFVFRVEIEAADQRSRDELLMQCKNSFEGCPFKVHTTHRENYDKQLRAILSAMNTDLTALDKYLDKKAAGQSAKPPRSYETLAAIDKVGINYSDCLQSSDVIALTGLKEDFKAFAQQTEKLWNGQGFHIVDSKKKLEALKDRSEYLQDSGVAIKIPSAFGQSSKKFVGSFESLYSPNHVPHLYEQIEASQKLWDHDNQSSTRGLYTGDNLGWACWMFAQPEPLGSSNSKCYDKMLSLNQIANEKRVPITQIAAEKGEAITDFLEMQKNEQYPLALELFSGVTLLRYSELDSPRNRLCYGSGSTIPSRNQTSDENDLLSLVESVKLVSTEVEFSDWAQKITPVLRYVCDTQDIKVPQLNSITIEKTLAEMDTLADLHDYLDKWLMMESDIKELLPEGSAVVFEVEDRIAQILTLVGERASTVVWKFSTPEEYRNQFCNEKAHVLMKDMLKKSREFVVPSVNSRYVMMIQKRMLRNGVDKTLKEIGTDVCLVDQEDSFFDCNPALVMDLSKEMSTGCNQSKCTTFKKDVETLKTRSASDQCLAVTGDVVCKAPTIYPNVGLINVEAPWRNTGTKQIGKACFQCVNGKSVSVKLNKQGFAGDRYVIYSGSSFKVNGNSSSTGSCKTVKQKGIGKSCSTKTFKATGSTYTFDVSPNSDQQCFYIEGI